MSSTMRTPKQSRGAGVPYNNNGQAAVSGVGGGGGGGGGGAHGSSSATPSSSGIPRPVVETSASEVGGASSVSASRQKQSKRDEAIRRKLENDLSKKKHLTSRARHSRKAPPGTVLALKPSAALQIKPSTTVAEAAQLMAAKREDCVLVTDDDERIAGIFTAKDLAFRVVGAALKASSVTIAEIMTKNPLCARTDTSATDALDLMVRKGFRHLPVMDENQDISGILDITKCFYDAMEKLERAYASSRKLYDALEGVQSELGASQPQQIIQYVEALRSKMSGPTLESILTGQPPTTVGVRTSVREAAQLMRDNHTTAVLVQDQGSITGIFTSKDVVLRVIAPGLDPATCSVVRVMTPHPDFAPVDMSIQAALRKMHDGHYLNLPVIDHTQEIVGMVDVLKLTYATLEQINGMSSGDSEGPAWNKFWLSLEDGTESMVSGDGSHHPTTNLGSRMVSPDHGRGDRVADSVAPGDSASHVGMDSPTSMHHPYDDDNDDDDDDDDDDRHHHHHHQQQQQHQQPLHHRHHSLHGSLPADVPFPFKFKAPSGRVHRLQITASDGIASFVDHVCAKLGSEAEGIGGVPHVDSDGKLSGGSGFVLSYLDDDGDQVSITTLNDLVEAIVLARQSHREKVDLYVHHPDRPAVTAASEILPTPTASATSLVGGPSPGSARRRRHTGGEEKVVAAAAAAADDDDDDDDADGEETDSTLRRRKTRSRQGSLAQQDQVIAGVPNELLLPGAIGFLAVVILGVFTISKITSR